MNLSLLPLEEMSSVSGDVQVIQGTFSPSEREIHASTVQVFSIFLLPLLRGLDIYSCIYLLTLYDHPSYRKWTMYRETKEQKQNIYKSKIKHILKISIKDGILLKLKHRNPRQRK